MKGASPASPATARATAIAGTRGAATPGSPRPLTIAAPGTVVEFYRHQLGEEEAASFRRVLDSLFLTLGPEVAAFEREMGEFLVRGRNGTEPPSVVGTNSCSMGLFLALRARDVGRGDE